MEALHGSPLRPCPPEMLEELKKKHEKNPGTQHLVLWDKTYYLNEEGSCQVLDYWQWQTKRRCDGYDPERYEVLAFMGEPNR